MHTKNSTRPTDPRDALSNSAPQSDPETSTAKGRQDTPKSYDTPHNLRVSRFLLTGPEYGEVASVFRQEDE